MRFLSGVGQGFVVAFALEAGGMGGGHSARSAITPAEHVGEHADGVSGCLAVADCGGTIGGVTQEVRGVGELHARLASGSLAPSISAS